ncbi:MAG: hypothetical protein JW910_04635 [Anaerolineae bacterium]|nr:hypothetical protein [Anaerolineae bacterium]
MASQSSQRNLNFREQEINYILTKLHAGDSCSVVGVGSVGKSNLLRHLLRPDVRQYHLSGEGALLNLILVDPNNMLDSLPLGMDRDSSSWAGYEIMVHRLYKTFHPFDRLDDEGKKSFLYAYRQLHAGDNPLLPYIGLRYLELALEQVLTPDTNLRIVFVFDEFEEMLEQLPTKFFQTLRGLRDDYKYRLMYLTFTRRPIKQIVQSSDRYDWVRLEAFVELFTDSTFFLGPYSETDGAAMLDRLSARQNASYSPSFRRFLLWSTGCFAGLLRAAFQLAGDIPFGTAEEQALQFLANSPAIRAECQTIWESLTDAERTTLLQHVRQQGAPAPNPEAVRLLQEKQLLTSRGTLEIAPPLFQLYVQRQAVAE